MSRPKDGRFWLLLAACIAFSRVWTGVHYPLDVAAGALIGIVSAAGVRLLFRLPVIRRLLSEVVRLYENVESRVWRVIDRKGS